MAEFPAMRFWTDSYLGDTTHLTCIEHGAYVLLLVTAWRSKTHLLPNDDKLLSQYCRLTKGQWLRIRPRLEPFFEINGGVWINQRLLDEIEAVRRQVAQRSDAGKRSALKRLHRGSTAVQRAFNEIPTPIPIPIKKEGNGVFEGSKKAEISQQGWKWYPKQSPQCKAWTDWWIKTKGVGPLNQPRQGEDGCWFQSEFPPTEH